MVYNILELQAIRNYPRVVLIMLFYHNNRKVTNTASDKEMRGWAGEGSWALLGTLENKPVESPSTVALGQWLSNYSPKKTRFVRNTAK